MREEYAGSLATDETLTFKRILERTRLHSNPQERKSRYCNMCKALDLIVYMELDPRTGLLICPECKDIVYPPMEPFRNGKDR